MLRALDGPRGRARCGRLEGLGGNGKSLSARRAARRLYTRCRRSTAHTNGAGTTAGRLVPARDRPRGHRLPVGRGHPLAGCALPLCSLRSMVREPAAMQGWRAGADVCGHGSLLGGGSLEGVRIAACRMGRRGRSEARRPELSHTVVEGLGKRRHVHALHGRARHQRRRRLKGRRHSWNRSNSHGVAHVRLCAKRVLRARRSVHQLVVGRGAAAHPCWLPRTCAEAEGARARKHRVHGHGHLQRGHGISVLGEQRRRARCERRRVVRRQGLAVCRGVHVPQRLADRHVPVARSRNDANHARAFAKRLLPRLVAVLRTFSRSCVGAGFHCGLRLHNVARMLNVEAEGSGTILWQRACAARHR